MLEQRERAGEVNAQKEKIRSSRQVHHAPRTNALFGVPKQAPTVCHDFRSHDYYPQASHSTRSLWISMPTARMLRTKNALPKCRSRCVGFSGFYVWTGLWPETPHQICQFHAIREAGRLIYNADHRVKTDMRIRRPRKNTRLSSRPPPTSAGS